MSRGNEPYRVEIEGAARRRLAKLDRKTFGRIIARVRALADDPRPHGAEKLTDRGDRYRVRVGDYRVVYAIDDAARVVTVAEVGHRSDIYRKGSG
jgi:mRNA interferase RelE/StbE